MTVQSSSDISLLRSSVNKEKKLRNDGKLPWCNIITSIVTNTFTNLMSLYPRLQVLSLLVGDGVSLQQAMDLVSGVPSQLIRGDAKGFNWSFLFSKGQDTITSLSEVTTNHDTKLGQNIMGPKTVGQHLNAHFFTTMILNQYLVPSFASY